MSIRQQYADHYRAAMERAANPLIEQARARAESQRPDALREQLAARREAAQADPLRRLIAQAREQAASAAAKQCRS